MTALQAWSAALERGALITRDDLAPLFKGWEAPQTATILGALIAVLGVAVTILTTSARSRREQRATLYADALAAVSDYLEGPYRIRRKDGTAAHRNAITASLSDVKSRIDHSQALLRLHAKKSVADAYGHYVDAAKYEAGEQMSNAWDLDPITKDREVNLGKGYDRQQAERYRSQVVRLMQSDLARRARKPWHGLIFSYRTRTTLPAPVRASGPPSATPEGDTTASTAGGTDQAERPGDAIDGDQVASQSSAHKSPRHRGADSSSNSSE